MLFWRKPNPKIQFLCNSEDEGIVASPIPSRAYLPAWLRDLGLQPDLSGAVDPGAGRCRPWLGAVETGWLIPLAATLQLRIADGGARVNGTADFRRPLVSTHARRAAANGEAIRAPLHRFYNPWTIVTPPGWSCLFVDPLNRPNPLFRVAAGVVATDSIKGSVDIPFHVCGADGIHVIERGAPLVQVIPFQRVTSELEAEIRAIG